MASQHDLQPRIDALQRTGLIIPSDYQGHPSQWLVVALEDVDARAINIKGCTVDDVPVLIRLSFLENLLAAVEQRLDHPMQAETPHAMQR
jgi:hypothetical protein